ncbi:DegT/DnrJ/EryC1/StrS family aminotransferase [Nocardia gipuzkoensis]
MYEFGDAEIAAATRVLTSQRLFRYMDDAEETSSFEAEFAATIGAGHGLATSSGTSALICGLSALGVGPGDEVIIPAYGFVADVIAVLAAGAVPVVCEIDESLTMDPADVAARITPRTRVLMPVHMNGFASDMAGITELAAAHDLAVLEDACQAIGGSFRGRRLGTFGAAGAFSFNQAKIITAGEGGMLVTDDRDRYERAFIEHDASCVHDGLAFGRPVFGGLGGYRMNEVSAAILRAQLLRLDSILERLRVRRDLLAGALADLPGLTRIPERDPAGSCGTHVGYRLENAEAVTALRELLADEKAFAMPTNAFGHSFFEWNMLHERRGAAHPGRNPLADRFVQGADALPVSREILDRSVVVGFGLDLDEAATEGIHRALSKEFG